MKRIEFETAKLVREAGYGYQESNGIYWPDGQFDHEEKYLFYNNVAYPAPFQAELQEWLRDVHDIYVLVACASDKYNDDNIWIAEIQYNNQAYVSSNGSFIEVNYATDYHADMYDTYEDALEVGLIEGLNMLTKNKKK